MSETDDITRQVTNTICHYFARDPEFCQALQEAKDGREQAVLLNGKREELLSTADNDTLSQTLMSIALLYVNWETVLTRLSSREAWRW